MLATTNLTLQLYRDEVNKLKARYSKRALEYLQSLIDHLRSAGVTCENSRAESGDDSQWEFVVRNGSATGEPLSPRDLIVTLRLAESYAHDKSFDGVAWLLTLKDGEGHQITKFQPGNYMDAPWTSIEGQEEIQGRFNDLLGCLDGKELLFVARTGKMPGD